MSIVALDLGSTTVKAVVILDDGVFASEPEVWRMPASVARVSDEHVVDAAVVHAAVTDLVSRVARHSSAPTELWMSGQMRGYLAVHGSGAPRYVTWQDRRGERPVDGRPGSAVLQELLGERWRRASGITMGPGVPLANLWHDHRAGHVASGARYVTLGGYLARRWCGVEVVEAGQAAASGMLDSRTGEWNPDALAILDDRLELPEIVDAGAPIGTADFDGRRLVVHPEVGDHQAAVLGALTEAGARVDDPVVTLTVGTAGIAARAVSERPSHPHREARPFFGTWLEVITRLPGGWQLASVAEAIDDRVLAITGARTDDVWPAVESVVLGTPIADFFAREYERAVLQLVDGQDPVHVIHTGGVLDRNPRLRDHIDARLGSPSRQASTEATLSGLGALARSHTLEGRR